MAGSLQPATHQPGVPLDDFAVLPAIGEVVFEGVLHRDGLGDPADAHRAIVLGPCQGEQARPGGLTQLVHQLRLTGGPDVTDAAKPECPQTFCGHRSDAGNGPCR